MTIMIANFGNRWWIIRLGPLTILVDGSTAGRGCVILIASLVYRHRALPLLWSLMKGKKDYLPQALRCALIPRLQEIVPANREA